MPRRIAPPSRGGDWNRLDAYEVAFHKRVRQGYLNWQRPNHSAG
jgi:hypothetical protein